MRTSNNILFLSIILSLVLASCVKEPAEFQATLNIVSLINPDDAFEVVIHSTAPALASHENLEVDDAMVIVKNNKTQQVNTLTNTGNGVYTSNGVKPIPGYDYEIQITAPGFPETYAATTHVPDLANLSIYVPENQNGNENLTFTFSANNSAKFFAYELIYSGQGKGDDDEEVEIDIPIEDLDQVIIENGIIRNRSLNPIVGAVSDGATTIVNSPKSKTPDGDFAELKDMSVRIVAVSPQYYEYLILEKNPEIDHFSSIYYNESNVFSNFVNGAYGIFGGFNERTIKLEE